MFKDTKEGTTHYQNDGCGEPAHNNLWIGKALAEQLRMEKLEHLDLSDQSAWGLEYTQDEAMRTRAYNQAVDEINAKLDQLTKDL